MWRIMAAAAALITLFSAYSSDGGDDQADAEPTTTTVAAVQLPAEIPPEPDQATADAYIAALVAINPGIVHRGGDTVGDVDTAISRGRDQCSTIYNKPDDRARQVETTIQRFTSPDAPQGWDAATAERILDVVHQHLCPTF